MADACIAFFTGRAGIAVPPVSAQIMNQSTNQSTEEGVSEHHRLVVVSSRLVEEAEASSSREERRGEETDKDKQCTSKC